MIKMYDRNEVNIHLIKLHIAKLLELEVLEKERHFFMN